MKKYQKNILTTIAIFLGLIALYMIPAPKWQNSIKMHAVQNPNGTVSHTTASYNTHLKCVGIPSKGFNLFIKNGELTKSPWGRYYMEGTKEFTPLTVTASDVDLFEKFVGPVPKC